MIANGWKTSKQIKEDYDLSPSQFKALRDECLTSTYGKAIIIVAGKTYIVDENLWQEFLISKSRQNMANEDEVVTNLDDLVRKLESKGTIDWTSMSKVAADQA